MNTIFELTFLDGQKRTVEAFNFSSAKAVAAYKRHIEEGCDSHKQLTVDDTQSRRVADAPAITAQQIADWRMEGGAGLVPAVGRYAPDEVERLRAVTAAIATTQQRMAAVFNEWARRYAENPDEFSAILDSDGKPVDDYGQCCALYFEKIAGEMDAKGLLPIPSKVPAPAPFPAPPKSE